MTYTTGSKAAQVAQSNTATGSPGTSTTRLSYPSATQTLVADPTTDQGQAVAAVAHTTYALTTDGTMLVSSATDPDGQAQSATYNPQTNNTLTQTSAAGGQSTFTYGANSNESLTQADSPGGAKGTATVTMDPSWLDDIDIHSGYRAAEAMHRLLATFSTRPIRGVP